MQNKGAIRLFAILLVIASLYSLYFTFVTRSVEADADEYAQGDLIKKNAYLDSIKSEPVYNFLWIKDFTYAACKERELNFGLDLKGGMNVTLEISVVDLLKGLSNNPTDSTLLATIASTKKAQEDSQEDFVTLFGKVFEENNPNARLAPLFISPEKKDLIEYNTSNEDVVKVLKAEAQDAIDNSFNVLRTRIDRFGVTQPNIQSLGAGRILVELPGVKDPARVRKLLQGTAKLEFWETYEAAEVWPFLQQANAKIKELNELAETNASSTEEDLAVADSAVVEASSEEIAVADSSADSTTAEVSLLDEIENDTTATDSTVATDIDREKEYPLFSVLQPRTDQEGRLAPGPTVGYAHVKDTAEVNAYLALEQVKKIMPRDLKFYWTVKSIDKDGNIYQLVAIKVSRRDGKAPLDGDVVTNAREEFGQTRTNAEVSMTMNTEGASAWARLTKENVGKSIAIVLDDFVYSSPRVQNEITGGRSSITGDFTIQEAKDLANVLKSGKLQAPARILEEVVVGPSLGKEAINSGLWSFAIAFAIVLLYMIFYYNKAGYVANLALIVNVFLILGVLASLGAVLTLPGIAGIVLTIGMSVDANVLIYERIREEIAAGKGLKLAVADGYKNAYSAIVDANVTTLLTGIILYYFGSGPIQGFATTLIIGIVTSLFCAILITRIIFERMLDKKSTLAFDTKLTRGAFKNLNVDFIGKRKVYYVISGLVVVAGIGSMIVRQWNVGVDFKGGRSYVVRFDEDVKSSDVSIALKDVYGEAPDVKTYGQGNQVKITTDFLINDKSTNTDSIVEAKLYEGLVAAQMIPSSIDYHTFISEHRMSSQKVGPTIADDIIYSAILSVLFSLIVIFVYIYLRFNNWQYGLGAVAALFHDVLILLGLFSLLYGIMPFSLEIDQAFIAAILTVIGYSINDTVVVFDRVREVLLNKKGIGRKEVLNAALNSTLSRTFSTSLSTFVVLLAIFIFGGETIRGFIFAMIIGVVVGTYSSLFIASPIMYDSVKEKEDEK